MFNTKIELGVFKFLYPVVFFWLVELTILINIPYAIIGLMKWIKGYHHGHEKLSDLVRATVFVKKQDDILLLIHLLR